MAGMLDPFEAIPPNCNRILLLGKEVSRIAPGHKPPRKAEKNMWCNHYQAKEKIEFEKLWTSTLLSVDERDVFLPTSETRRVNFNLWCFGRPFCAHVIILHPSPKTQSKGTSTKHQQGYDINMTWTSMVYQKKVGFLCHDFVSSCVMWTGTSTNSSTCWCCTRLAVMIFGTWTTSRWRTLPEREGVRYCMLWDVLTL